MKTLQPAAIAAMPRKWPRSTPNSPNLQVVAEFDGVKTRMMQLEEENKQLKQAAESTANEITDLKATTVYAYSGLENNTEELNSLKEEVMNLKRRNIKLEAYTRRENIKIFGIEDERGESNTRTEELVRIMMREKMNIPEEDVEGFQFERVHRIPTRQDILAHPNLDRLLQNLAFTKTRNICGPLLRTSKAGELESLTISRKRSTKSTRSSIRF